jgi:predicted RNase H-like HicB family nuclease
MARPLVVTADWDAEAKVWVAASRDLPGFATDAESIEALRAKLPALVMDILEENGLSEPPASIEIIARVSEPMPAD